MHFWLIMLIQLCTRTEQLTEYSRSPRLYYGMQQAALHASSRYHRQVIGQMVQGALGMPEKADPSLF